MRDRFTHRLIEVYILDPFIIKNVLLVEIAVLEFLIVKYGFINLIM